MQRGRKAHVILCNASSESEVAHTQTSCNHVPTERLFSFSWLAVFPDHRSIDNGALGLSLEIYILFTCGLPPSIPPSRTTDIPSSAITCGKGHQ